MNMIRICKTLEEVLDLLVEEGWDPQEDISKVDYQRYYMNYDVENPFTIYLIYFSERKVIQFRAMFPDDVPSHKRKDIRTFIALLNKRFSFGVMEINELNQHLISFRTGFDFRNINLSSLSILKNLTFCAARMKKYIPVLREIIKTNKEVNLIFKENFK